ncbi:lytic transglycosylase domain-containing protein [bacterium]|nr:MAG: lytic transglycosylase domain-containing protein [bacterium]
MVVVPDPVPTKPYKRLFARLLKENGKTDRYDDALLSEARKRGLDPRLLKAIIAAESEFNPKALSPKGALGLMQVMPATAESMGVPRGLIKDPWQNIRAGAAYIAKLYEVIAARHNMKGVRMADAPVWMVQRVIASYHAGPKFLARGSWYKSTRLYVRKVLLFYQSRVTDVRRQSSAAVPAEGLTVAWN